MVVVVVWLGHHDPLGGLINLAVAVAGGVTVFFLVAVVATALASQGEDRGRYRRRHGHRS